MALFRNVAQDQKGAVIVVTHDDRALDVLDLIYEIGEGKVTRKEDEQNAAYRPNDDRAQAHRKDD